MIALATATVVTGLLPAGAAPSGAVPANAATAPGVTHIALTDDGGRLTPAATAGDPSPAATAGKPSQAAAAIRTRPLAVDEFVVAGLTWAPGEELSPDADIRMRVREDGHWSEWLTVEPDEASDAAVDADSGSASVRPGTDPFITGGADGVQVVVTGDARALPADLQLSLYSTGGAGGPDDGVEAASSASADALDAGIAAEAGTAAVSPEAMVVTRAGWGLTADEEEYTTLHWTPKYYPLQAAVVHHTAGTNSYAAAESPGIVHAIWNYHAITRGWGDIGYNFLVDKYGQMFEGRRHSLPLSGEFSVSDDVPTGWSIEAAHAAGYNKGGLGISALGDYTKLEKFADPDDPDLLTAITHLIAWKFNLANVDVVDAAGDPVPSGFLSPGTSTTYPAGAALPRIFVHKDVAATDCPGSIANAAVISQIFSGVEALYATYPQALDTTPPSVTLSATTAGAVTLSGSDDSGAAPAMFYTTDGPTVFYSPDWTVSECGAALTGVTNPRSCVVDTRYTDPFTLDSSASVSYLGVDDAANTSAQMSTNVELGSTIEPNTTPAVTITAPADGTSYDSGATITFSGTASDSEDGDLTESIVWTSDGVQIGTGGNVTADLSVGAHTIIAEVTDSGGLTGAASITITVADDQPTVIALTVTTRKVKTTKYADLNWQGAKSTTVDVHRNGSSITTTANDGAYTDTLSKTVTSATYQVCETGTSTCSNEVTVSW